MQTYKCNTNTTAHYAQPCHTRIDMCVCVCLYAYTVCVLRQFDHQFVGTACAGSALGPGPRPRDNSRFVIWVRVHTP